MTESPPTFADLLRHCTAASNGARSWGIWHVYIPKLRRHFFYGRAINLGDPRRKVSTRKPRPWYWDVVCLRCGRGHNNSGWHWAAKPGGYDPERWISVCFTCLCVWADLWPDIFRRFRLGIATFQWRAEPHLISPDAPRLDKLSWHLRPPFGNLPPMT